MRQEEVAGVDLLPDKVTRLLVGLVICVAALPVSGQRSAHHRGASELMQLVESHYGRVRGLTADFEQRYVAPGLHERREYGTLLLLRPRKMKWEYRGAPGKLFIVNDRDVWFYAPDDREAVHARTESLSDSRLPFLFLLNNFHLSSRFYSMSLLEDHAPGGTLNTLRIVPRTVRGGVRELRLEVDQDGRVHSLSSIDEGGSVNTVVLTNVHENSVIPTGTFDFFPPPGVRIRRMQ